MGAAGAGCGAAGQTGWDGTLLAIGMFGSGVNIGAPRGGTCGCGLQ